MKRLSDQTLYEILEVPVDAPGDEIERAYARAVALYGPGSLATYSLVSSDEARLLNSRIEEAHAVLLDPAARSGYDERIGVRAPAAVPAQHPAAAPATTPATTPWPPPAPVRASPPVPPEQAASPEPAPPGPAEGAGPTPTAAPDAAGPIPEPAAAPRQPPLPALAAEVGPVDAPPTAPPLAPSSAIEAALPPAAPARAQPEPGRLPLPLTAVVAAAAPTATPVPGLAQGPILLKRELAAQREVLIPEGAAWTGEMLRQVREARGLSSSVLSDRTKVIRYHIENIEADRFEKLPAPVYLRGILMSVARELRLDGQKVARSYLERSAAEVGPAPRK